MDWISAIQQVGFPIAVTAWLLINGSKERKEMTGAIDNLSNLINKVLIQEKGGEGK